VWATLAGERAGQPQPLIGIEPHDGEGGTVSSSPAPPRRTRPIRSSIRTAIAPTSTPRRRNSDAAECTSHNGVHLGDPRRAATEHALHQTAAAL
jgi:hypothetical protein